MVAVRIFCYGIASQVILGRGCMVETLYKVETGSKDTPDQVLFDDINNKANQCVYIFTSAKMESDF